jgi:hypothetical protein
MSHFADSIMMWNADCKLMYIHWNDQYIHTQLLHGTHLERPAMYYDVADSLMLILPARRQNRVPYNHVLADTSNCNGWPSSHLLASSRSLQANTMAPSNNRWWLQATAKHRNF